MALGLTFLVVKFFEYKEKFVHHHMPGPNFRASKGRMPGRRRSSSRCISR